MTSRNKRIAAIAAIVLGIIVLIAVALAARSCGSEEPETTGTVTAGTTSSTASSEAETTTSGIRTVTITTSVSAPEPEHGPYMTQAQAVDYVESLGEPASGNHMVAVEPGSTWHVDAVLHAIRATVSGSASYAGDYYYFFANGYPVGQEYFTHGEPAPAPGADTFVVSFAVYNPGDPHCCPSGGTATVRFRWDGNSLRTLDPMTGAVM